MKSLVSLLAILCCIFISLLVHSHLKAAVIPTVIEMSSDPVAVSDFKDFPKKITFYISLKNMGKLEIIQASVGPKDDKKDYESNSNETQYQLSLFLTLPGNSTHITCGNNTTCSKFYFTLSDNEGFDQWISKKDQADAALDFQFKFHFEGRENPITTSYSITKDINPPIEQVDVTKVSGVDEHIVVSWTKPKDNKIKSKDNQKDVVDGYVIYYWYLQEIDRAGLKQELAEECLNDLNVADRHLNNIEVLEGRKSFDCLESCDFDAIKTKHSPLQMMEESEDSDEAMIRGLENDKRVAFIVLYKDQVGLIGTARPEEGAKPQCYTAKPVQTFSLGEFYGLTDEQKFTEAYCFIATATYGSASESHVLVFRKFRDLILEKYSLGRLFVKAYYQYSPRIAAFIQDSPGWRLAFRILLYPFYLLALLALSLSSFSGWGIFGIFVMSTLILFTVLVISAFLLIKKMNKLVSIRNRKALMPILFIVSFFFSFIGPAEGLGDLLQWNKSKDRRSIAISGGLPKYTKFGNIVKMEGIRGEQVPREKSPYEAVFGKPNAYIMLQYEYYLFNFFGKLGIGGYLGFCSDKGKSLVFRDVSSNQIDRYSEIDEFTNIFLFPFSLYLSYKFDYLAESYFTPYVNIGFQEIVFRGKKGLDGFRGNRKGIIWSVGAWINLDWIQPTIAAQMENFYSITN